MKREIQAVVPQSQETQGQCQSTNEAAKEMDSTPSKLKTSARPTFFSKYMKKLRRRLGRKKSSGGLGDNELEEAWATADEQTNQAPHKGDVYSGRYELFVLGSWKDGEGGLLTSGQVDTVGQFDFNEHLGISSSFMKCKDWQVILPAWEDFIGDAFNQDGTLLRGTRWVLKPYHEFNLDCMGLLMLPNIEGVLLSTKKGMIQSFVTIYYHKPVDRKPTASSDAHHHRNMLWKTEGPSALEQHNEGTVGLILKFKAWINDKSKMHAPVSKESDDSNSDADDEGMWLMPTKTSSAAAAPSPAGVPKGGLDVPLPKGKVQMQHKVTQWDASQSQMTDWLPRALALARESELSLPSSHPEQTWHMIEDRPIMDLVRKVSHDRRAYVAGNTCMPAAQVTEGSEDESYGHIAMKASARPGAEKDQGCLRCITGGKSPVAEEDNGSQRGITSNE
ncbi:uncharacterized protein F5891DRAFT_980356 [Suillus fuscotomentosus]|uniref:Uncharacterized protein n=1 Tax=Suillus fuscotomentosus TaxID=1912939 RepID=A0AAD4E6S5_9AGAM|nr:uncharacterized protein F5891DRAFT_980356 [Suillus fuscotomentosus]KAG1900407.1 hypothetical protein F5891DRAFT_980356 [Suillus fuscotomentosus]